MGQGDDGMTKPLRRGAGSHELHSGKELFEADSVDLGNSLLFAACWSL